MTKKPEQPVVAPPADEAPAEHPVLGYEPLYVPKGVTLTGVLERLDVLETEVAELKSNAVAKKSSTKIDA